MRRAVVPGARTGADHHDTGLGVSTQRKIHDHLTCFPLYTPHRPLQVPASPVHAGILRFFIINPGQWSYVREQVWAVDGV